MARLTKTQLKQYRSQLIHYLRELESRLGLIEETVLQADDDFSPADQSEAGGDNYQREFQLGIIDNGEEIHREVLYALARIDDGSFGLCLGCSASIPERRLEVRPYASHCVSCQERLDRGETLDPE